MDLKGAEIRNIKELCMDIGAKSDVPLKINIPYYQRPYRWGREQINNLVNDFFKNKQENNQAEYFVGSVVLVKNARGSERHDIIDGQQRITTVFLLNYLRFIMLRAYIEELININRTNIDSFLKDFEECYGHLLGSTKKQSFSEMRNNIVDSLDTINEVNDIERIKLYDDILEKYQQITGLPTKDFSDIKVYASNFKDMLFDCLNGDELSLQYSRQSYNEKLVQALSKIMIIISKDKKPELILNDCEDNPIIQQYTNALLYEFNALSENVIDLSKAPLDNAKLMITAIDELLNNLKFCVIMTGNEKDAYTLFEVLNDRALEIDDLDLIKNLYFKEYCTKTKDNDNVIDKNIEKLDSLWGDDIFTHDLRVGHVKLISYLGTIYLTADEDVFKNKIERYREILETKYFDVNYNKVNKTYEYKTVYNDIKIYQMIKLVIKVFELPLQNAASAAIKAECDVHKSITYKVFHLMNALGQDGVMPALTNLILRTYIEKNGANNIIDINNFEKYLRDLATDNEHLIMENEIIYKWSFEIWKAILYSKDYNIPREIAKSIISKVNFYRNEISSISISAAQAIEMQDELEEWISQWKYGTKNGDIKAKILFINLFKTNKSENKLTLNPAVHTFVTDKLQLDHMEADKPNPICAEKYFKPSDANDKREVYVNGLGNFMILDSNDNNNKDNKPLQDAMQYYEKMCPNHWMNKETIDLLSDSTFSNIVKVANEDYHVPNEKFFQERRKRLHKYFRALLSRKLGDKEMQIN